MSRSVGTTRARLEHEYREEPALLGTPERDVPGLV